MTDQKNTIVQSAVPPAAPVAEENLAAEIALTIARNPGEKVTCRRVFENHYRCNWWGAESTAAYDNPGMYGLLVTTHRVRKSRFLRVTRTADGLVIKESSNN